MPSRINDLDLNDRTNPAAASADPALSKLSGPSFDVVSFLNEFLPVVSISSAQQPGSNGSKIAQIQDASSQLQVLLRKANTQHIRSSSQLTQVTDDMLRSGSRLAYEVEVLRGDTNGLYEVLTETLRNEIHQFVTEQVAMNNEEDTRDDMSRGREDPEFILQLRMLGQVKARLEAVIHVFGEAMKWSVPPESSVASSLISVSAPELAMMEITDRVEQEQETAQQYRAEIIDLLDSDGGGYAGLEAASDRVERLRLLCAVWKGAADEKARSRFVDNLSKLVQDRKKALDARALPQRVSMDTSIHRSSSVPGRSGARTEGTAPAEASNATSGLFRNLQKLRDEIYLD